MVRTYFIKTSSKMQLLSFVLLFWFAYKLLEFDNLRNDHDSHHFKLIELLLDTFLICCVWSDIAKWWEIC